ncbi:MAG: cation:proton antiporter [Staphylothermus sp.]|nr:cation:proton antiporter [Staphylothermus sp.]
MIAKVLELPLRKQHLHPIAGHVIAGLILGPYVLGLIKPAKELLGVAYLGLLLLMFYTGLTTDFKELRKRNIEVIVMGGMGVLVTFTLIYVALLLMGITGLSAVFISAALSNTATETVAGIVARKGDAKTKSLLIGASFVDDVMAVFIIGILAGLGTSGTIQLWDMLLLSAKTLLFLFLVFYVSRLLVTRFTGFYKFISQDYFWFATASILLAFGLAVLAKLSGLSELIGSYLAGILISRGREYHDPMLRTRIAISEFIGDFTVILDVIFIPLFFTYIGLSYAPTMVDPLYFAVLLVLAIIGKFLGTTPIAYYALRDKRKSIAIGLGMSGRGALETALLKLGLDYGIINSVLFNTAITVSITTTIVAPLLFSIAYKE